MADYLFLGVCTITVIVSCYFTARMHDERERYRDLVEQLQERVDILEAELELRRK